MKFQKGNKIGGRFKKGNKINLGKTFSEEHKQNMREARKRNPRYGENTSCWRGGTTSLNHKLRNLLQYRQWRSDVFTRDNYTCQTCDKRGVRLQADHIKRFIDIIREYNIKSSEEAVTCEELWNINNGRTLCIECHRKTETFGNKNKKS